ncbi:MAG: cupin domain-containing protein [Bacteroidales bacterium]|nr:cupin domain-containing protein [Bacteroidales bacterium]
MIIKNPQDIPYEDTSAYKGVKKQIYLGHKDGSNEIIMRYFTVEPGGATPYHKHGFQHLVKVESGNGIVIDKDGVEHKISAGELIYVQDYEVHGFKNVGDEPFSILCIVPARGEK